MLFDFWIWKTENKLKPHNGTVVEFRNLCTLFVATSHNSGFSQLLDLWKVHHFFSQEFLSLTESLRLRIPQLRKAPKR